MQARNLEKERARLIQRLKNVQTDLDHTIDPLSRDTRLHTDCAGGLYASQLVAAGLQAAGLLDTYILDIKP